MVLAVGQEMQLYSSPNLKDWTMRAVSGKDKERMRAFGNARTDRASGEGHGIEEVGLDL